MRLAVLAVLAASMVVGCAAHFGNPSDSEDLDAAAERPLGPAHGVEGELVEYEVKLHGLAIGRVQVAVGTRGLYDGRPSVIVRSRAVGAGLADVLGEFTWELTTTVDIDAGCAVEEDEDIAIEIATKRQHEHRTRKFKLETCRQNMHTSAGALRGWRSRPGAHAAVEVWFDDRPMPVTFTDAARVTIGTVLGSLPAVRYDGILRNVHSFSAWLSDDEARVPLLLRTGSKLGAVELELVSYRADG